LAEMGGFVEGAGVEEEALRLAEAAEQPFSIAAALTFVGLLYRRQGDVQQAIPALERGLALSQTANILMLFPLTASSLGAAYALAGRVAEALPLLDQMRERVVTGGRTPYQSGARRAERSIPVRRPRGRGERACRTPLRALPHPHRTRLSGACI